MKTEKQTVETMLTDETQNNLAKTDKVNHPENGIVLMDNTVLQCFPKEASPAEFNASKPNIEDSTAQQQLFVDNAYYLLAHRDRIMRDSRMFLAPVAVLNGLAFLGPIGFKSPTIGVYLEWWENCMGAVRIENGRRSLVYKLVGSPLSGNNRCGEVFEDGTTNVVTLMPFNVHWRPFVDINTRYTEAKRAYQAYSLQEVLDILHSEDEDKTSYARNINQYFNQYFMHHELRILRERVKEFESRSSEYYQKYQEILVLHNEANLRKACMEYKSFEIDINSEIERLKAQKQRMKKELRLGLLDNISYQRKVMPLNKCIDELAAKLKSMLHKIYIEFNAIGIDGNTLRNYLEQIE